MPHLLLVRSGQDKGNTVCAATGAAASAAALIKQLANSVDHEVAIPPIENFCQGVATFIVPRSTFCFQLSCSPCPCYISPPLPSPLSACRCVISTHRTRWLTISMLQQWQQYDCLSVSVSALPLPLSLSLSLSHSLCLSVSVQFMI